MKQCEWCDRTAAAVRTGFWPEELRAHAAACEDCAETMLVAGALLEAATLEARGGLRPQVWSGGRRSCGCGANSASGWSGPCAGSTGG